MFAERIGDQRERGGVESGLDSFYTWLVHIELETCACVEAQDAVGGVEQAVMSTTKPLEKSCFRAS